MRHDIDDIDGRAGRDDIGDLDRILASEEPLAPSSGFAAAVMESVREAAAEPPPLPFPWTRFAAGAIACLVWAAAGVALIVNTDWSAFPAAHEVTESLRPVLPELGYAAAAVLASLAVLSISRVRGVSRRG
jgi:hypothetical protein